MFWKLICFLVFVKINAVLPGLVQAESGDAKNKRQTQFKVDFLQVDESDFELNQRFNNVYDDLTNVLNENSKESNKKSQVSLANLLDKTKALLEIFKFEKDRNKIIIKQTNDTENKPIKIPTVKNNSIVDHLHIQIENIPMKVVYVNNAIIIETRDNADEEKVVIENDLPDDNVAFICEEHVSPPVKEEKVKKPLVTDRHEETTIEAVTTVKISDNFFPTQLPRQHGVDYVLNDEENDIDYLNFDYLELFKDTTNEIPVTTTDIVEVEVYADAEGLNDTLGLSNNTTMDLNGSCNSEVRNQTLSDVIFPWIAAIFIRNNDTNEFEYICDGAILGERAILTAARCIGNSTVEDVLVLLGKRSLQKMDGNEVYRIQESLLHKNFKVVDDNAHSDLAILVPEKPIVYNKLISKACLLGPQENKEEIIDSITTGWQISGELIDIRLQTSRNDTTCLKASESSDVFCAAYDNSKKTCPSYGGLHLVKLPSNMWYLDGILTEDTRRRGVCLHKSRRFTDLTSFIEWLRWD